jgi:hypothetical protein
MTTPAELAAAKADIAAASATLQKMSLNTNAAEFSPSVSHVAVKLPDFWTKEPELWFMQADANFRRAKITCSLTKYDYVLQRLPMDVLISVKELARRVRTGEVDDPYEQLEAKLTASYQRSPWQLAFDLLDMPDLGDRRPSVLMDTMLASLPDDCQPNRLFLALFLRRLPADIRDQLVAQDLKDPAAMAAVADRIYDARPQSGHVHAIPAAPAAVHAVDGRSPSPAGRRRPNSRRERNRRQPSRRRDEDPDNGLCFYHTNFGARASRCRPPCGWPGNGRAADGLGN